jgi:hypothetical protein
MSANMSASTSYNLWSDPSSPSARKSLLVSLERQRNYHRLGLRRFDQVDAGSPKDQSRAVTTLALELASQACFE